jgi:hypothetical protein
MLASYSSAPAGLANHGAVGLVVALLVCAPVLQFDEPAVISDAL